MWVAFLLSGTPAEAVCNCIRKARTRHAMLPVPANPPPHMRTFRDLRKQGEEGKVSYEVRPRTSASAARRASRCASTGEACMKCKD